MYLGAPYSPGVGCRCTPQLDGDIKPTQKLEGGKKKDTPGDKKKGVIEKKLEDPFAFIKNKRYLRI